jgi:hypothetical protein
MPTTVVDGSIHPELRGSGSVSGGSDVLLKKTEAPPFLLSRLPAGNGVLMVEFPGRTSLGLTCVCWFQKPKKRPGGSLSWRWVISPMYPFG